MEDSVLVQMRFKRSQLEDLDKKAEASGLERTAYVKLILSKVGLEAVIGGKFLKDQRRTKKLFKQEYQGLVVAESHALRALSQDYNPILAVNELWIFNRGWVKALVRQWCDKYEVDLEDFEMNRTIAKVIIKAYFEIDDICERKAGHTRGRYKLKPDYKSKDVKKFEEKRLRADAAKFDRLMKKVNAQLDKEEQEELLKLENEKVL